MQSVLGILILSTIWLVVTTKPSACDFFLPLSTFAYVLIFAIFRNFDFNSVHVEGAERIARISAESGVSRFVHVSHLNASPSSQSSFYKSKAQGEEKVKASFPNATIVRPAAMYGHEDRLLNSMAGE